MFNHGYFQIEQLDPSICFPIKNVSLNRSLLKKMRVFQWKQGHGCHSNFDRPMILMLHTLSSLQHKKSHPPRESVTIFGAGVIDAAAQIVALKSEFLEERTKHSVKNNRGQRLFFH